MAQFDERLRRCDDGLSHHFSASARKSGGGGSETQIERSNANGETLILSRLKFPLRSLQATCRILPFGMSLTCHTRVVLSKDAVTTNLPSRLKGGRRHRPCMPREDSEGVSGGRIPNSSGVVF